MHLIFLKLNTTACKLKNLSRYSSLKLMYYINFLLKQSEVYKSHSQEKQKLSCLGLESFWSVVGDDPKAFLMKHVLKPSLSDFAHYFPSFLIPGPSGCCISCLAEGSLASRGCRQAVSSSHLETPWRSGWKGILSVPTGEPQCLLAWRSTLLLSH